MRIPIPFPVALSVLALSFRFQVFAEHELQPLAPIQTQGAFPISTNGRQVKAQQPIHPNFSGTERRPVLPGLKKPSSQMDGPALNATVSKPVVQGDALMVKLTLQNNLPETIESARAVVFVTDETGKMVAEAARWVVGNADGNSSLESGATNQFNFVLRTRAATSSTNLAAQVSFNRVVLENGKLADLAKDIRIVSE